MPMYEYECRKCGHRFELRRRFEDEDDGIECSECGAKHPERVISAPEMFFGGGGCAPVGGG